MNNANDSNDVGITLLLIQKAELLRRREEMNRSFTQQRGDPVPAGQQIWRTPTNNMIDQPPVSQQVVQTMNYQQQQPSNYAPIVYPSPTRVRSRFGPPGQDLLHFIQSPTVYNNQGVVPINNLQPTQISPNNNSTPSHSRSSEQRRDYNERLSASQRDRVRRYVSQGISYEKARRMVLDMDTTPIYGQRSYENRITKKPYLGPRPRKRPGAGKPGINNPPHTPVKPATNKPASNIPATSTKTLNSTEKGKVQNGTKTDNQKPKPGGSQPRKDGDSKNNSDKKPETSRHSSTSSSSHKGSPLKTVKTETVKKPDDKKVEPKMEVEKKVDPKIISTFFQGEDKALVKDEQFIVIDEYKEPEIKKAKKRSGKTTQTQKQGYFKVIIRDNNKLFSKKEVQILKEAISDSIWSSEFTNPPEFHDSFLQEEYMMVICKNEESAEWLKKTAITLTPWPNSNLMVMSEEEYRELKRTLVGYFNCTGKMGGTEILKAINKQNPTLKTDEWTVVSERKGKVAVELKFRVDLESMQKLGKDNFKIYFGLGVMQLVIEAKETEESLAVKAEGEIPSGD